MARDMPAVGINLRGPGVSDLKERYCKVIPAT